MASLIIALIVITASVISGYMIWKDSSSFQNNFPSSKNLFLLEKNGKIMAGFEAVLDGAEEPVYLDSAPYSDYINSFPGYYKTVVMHDLMFDSITELEIGEFVYPKTEIDNYLGFSNAYEVFITNYSAAVSEEEDIPVDAVKEQVAESFSDSGVKDDSTLKAMLSAQMFGKVMEEDDFFALYHDSKLDIYPKTIFLKILKKMPKSLLKIIARSEA